MINADGTVDTSLSRSATVAGDIDDHERLLAFAKQWRFEPGVRDGVPVRAAIDLDIRTDRRPSDTLPARIVWRYVPGLERDSLVGQWMSDVPEALFTTEQVDSVHVGMLRNLVATGVVRDANGRRYCIAPSEVGKDSEARAQRVARAMRGVGPRLSTGNCVDGVDRVRLLLPRVLRTENGRAVLKVAGAQLPHWPGDFDGAAWPRWAGRCVGAVRGGATVSMRCEVSPDLPWDQTLTRLRELGQRRVPVRVQGAEPESLHVTVLAMLTGAPGIDTIRRSVGRLPRLRDFALRDSVEALRSWFVVSPHPLDSTALVVHGNPARSDFHVTPAQSGSEDSLPRPLPYTALADVPDRFAAFLLGGVGTRPLAPLTLCFASCTRRYVLHAEANTLQPTLRFKIASLSASSDPRRAQFEMRVLVDPVPSGFVPLVAITDPRGRTSSAWFLLDRGDGVWGLNVHYSPVFWQAQEVLVYLVRR